MPRTSEAVSKGAEGCESPSLIIHQKKKPFKTDVWDVSAAKSVMFKGILARGMIRLVDMRCEKAER